MSLFNYDRYIKEALTPEEIEEKKKMALASHMRMYISKDLANILKRMDNPVAYELLTLSRKNIRFDISFMDIDKKKPGMVTYISTMKVKKMEEKGLDVKNARNNYSSDLWVSSQRVQPTKIGKVVTKIFKGKFKPTDFEQFSNEFKSKADEQDDKMRIVYGDEIKKWYLESNYAKMSGPLGGSCMRSASRNPYMSIYAENQPEDGNYSSVGMLILLDDNNKLLGRAIVWFNSIKPEPGRTFMDRIYTTKDSDIITFKDYAIKHDWLYKKVQSYSDNAYVDPRDKSNHNLSISFRLKINKKYKYYPYMDTLKYYTPETGRISSVRPKTNKYRTHTLQSTGGGTSD